MNSPNFDNIRIQPCRVIVLFCVQLLFVHVQSAAAIGVYTDDEICTDSVARHDETEYRIKTTNLIPPLSAIAVGSLALADDAIKNSSHRISDEIRGWRNGKARMYEDYFQYVPIIAAVTLGSTGIKARHNMRDRLIIAATAYASLGLMTNIPKNLISEKRPESSATNSFPSGHTATAFMGAELARIEYGALPGVMAYAIAVATAYMRIYNGRHWLHDTVAGAGVGVLSARIGEWCLPVWKRAFKIIDRKHVPVLTLMPTTSLTANKLDGVAFNVILLK